MGRGDDNLEQRKWYACDSSGIHLHHNIENIKTVQFLDMVVTGSG